MKDYSELIGKRYGRLVVVGFDYKKSSSRRKYLLCKCDCGNKISTRLYELEHKQTVSCGCYNREILQKSRIKHGLSNHPLHREWRGIKDRCYNKNCKQFKDYGGRGITVCDEWIHDAAAFINWCLSHGYEKGLTLDRIDNNKGYSPDNCRWTTRKIQANNTRRNRYITYNGETHTVPEWAEILNLKYDVLIHRLAHGWSVEKAIETPFRNFERHDRTYTFNGETHNLKEWSKILHINYRTLLNRISDSGWDIEKVLTTPVTEQRLITFDGRTMTATEWCKEKGWERHIVSRRLAKGWSVEKTLSTPVKTYKTKEV